MLKLVFDADGLIKLARSGILRRATVHVRCFASHQVYEEVLRGKEKLYEDAFIIEELATTNNIMVKQTKPFEEPETLGAGERAALALFRTLNADAIVSDDLKFLTSLEAMRVPFIIPTHLIVLLAQRSYITHEQARHSLSAIRPFVREQNYQEAQELIRGD